MKIRESGMPGIRMWEQFFDIPNILAVLGINESIKDVAEFGCGYGTFTIPAAKVIKGKIFAFDIEPEMVTFTKDEATRHSLKNVEVILRDFMTEGTGLKPESVDYAMVFNILHLENPVDLLLEAKRILKKKGTLGIIHWVYDASTPRGPSMSIRPKIDDCVKWGKEAGFVEPIVSALKPYHYGIAMTKKGTGK